MVKVRSRVELQLVTDDTSGALARRRAGADQREHMARVDIRVVGEHVDSDRLVLGDRRRIGDRDRGVVGAGDGDRQGRARGRAVLVGHRVIEHFGGARSLRQLLRVGVRIVECIGPAAVGVDRHRPIGACDRTADVRGRAVDVLDGQYRATVDVRIVGEHVARSRRVAREGRVAGINSGFDDEVGAVDVSMRDGRIVHALIDDRDGRPGQRAVRHSDRVGEGVVRTLTGGKRLQRGFEGGIEIGGVISDLAVARDPDVRAV